MPDTYWDRAAQAYHDFWVPRLIPYYDDLVQKSVPKPGERVLVTCAGPGGELLAVARAMEGTGTLVATDTSREMLALARRCLADADPQMAVTLKQAEANDTLGARWDLILSAFSLWQLPGRRETLASWRSALRDEGRVGLLVWGPPDPAGPFEMVAQALLEMEPALADASKTRELA
ncbi:MAG: methyltransferase domain-containing protein, partial [Polyangiaceae bacterium]|nr:methyltransferase domain-containing protein [Polyangiaceae bacterium]